MVGPRPEYHAEVRRRRLESGKAQDVGFTGTRSGMTDEQRASLTQVLVDERVHRFHHGDCVGADEEAARVARNLSAIVIAHPPLETRYRAFFDSDFMHSPATYLARNHDIVDACTVLVATPRTVFEVRRSGTWATVRYARKIGRRVVLIAPNGEEMNL